MLAKFHGNILNLSENIAKSFRGATFLTHTVVTLVGTTILQGFRGSVKGVQEPKRPKNAHLSHVVDYYYL